MDPPESAVPAIPPDPGSDLRSDSMHEGQATLLLTKALKTLLGRGGMVLVSFAFAVALARSLDPAERGSFALLQALNGLTVVLSNLAVSKAIVHHIGKGLLAPAQAIGAALSAAAVSGALGALVLIPAALLLRDVLIPGLTSALIVCAILLAAPLLVREYVGGVLVALGRPLDLVAATAVQPVTALLALLVVSVVGTGSFLGVVTAWAIGIALSALAALGLTLGRVRTRPVVRRQDLRSVGVFGVKAYPAFVARFLNLRLDQFLIRALGSAAVLGEYAVAVNIGELLIRIPTIMLWAVSGAISSYPRDQSALLVAQFCRWTVLILTVAALAIGLVAPVAVPMIFGARYRPAIMSVILLLPGMIFYAPATIITEYFIVQRGRPAKAALIPGIATVASLILNVPLTPAFGANGASVASTISYFGMLAIGVFLFARDTGVRPLAVIAVSRADLTELGKAFRHFRVSGRSTG